MKKLHVAVMSLCILCCLGWMLNVFAAKYDPFVEKAQKRLAELGYDVGTADGKMGPNTIEAIKKFQHDQGLAVTGKLDEETIQKLGLSETKETPSPKPTEIPTVQPQEQKSQSSWVITDIKTGIKSEILTNAGGQVHPKEEMKVFLEVVGMFSRADNIEQPAKVDEIFVTQEKTTYEVTGIGLMSGSECSYSTGRIIAGFLGLETPYGSISLGRKEKTDPLTLALKKSPSQLCFACIVPKDLKGDLSFHFADVVIPISIK